MQNQIRISSNTPWYDLFSRGARDWLRHNDKVRDAVQRSLPDLVAQSDMITGSAERTVQVPVHMLEHARFRLADLPFETHSDAGQGQGKVGDVMRPLSGDPGDAPGKGNTGKGEITLLLELSVDDIMDWLWEELKLPDLAPRPNCNINDQDLVREGWDKHGARARLDRRRTVKEAVKRRAMQPDAPAFINDDLRFRQLVQRRKPATNAVVIFALDVSASMTEAERKLAKSFFFFVLQGIRRRYARVETRFIAHTTEAWEFSEEDFFKVSGSGGTGASTAFRLALNMIRQEYDPAQYNAYLFYASDGENFTEDRQAASSSLGMLTDLLNYVGYVETIPGSSRTAETEMKMICSEIERRGAAIGTSVLMHPDDVWKAIRKFFVQQSQISELA
jgi:uncharacterized sporulation protein YeaH/YhbH (DUF444 family)